MPADPSRRTAPYITSPEASRKADRKPAPPSPWIAEAAPPEYSIRPAWIDTAGRTRTWALRDPRERQWPRSPPSAPHSSLPPS